MSIFNFSEGAYSAKFDAERNRILAIGGGGELKIADLKSGRIIHESTMGSGLIGLGIKSDCSEFVVAERNGTISRFETETLKLLKSRELGVLGSSPYSDVVFLEEIDAIAIGNYSSGIYFLDANDLRTTASIGEAETGLWAVGSGLSLVPNKKLVCCGRDSAHKASYLVMIDIISRKVEDVIKVAKRMNILSCHHSGALAASSRNEFDSENIVYLWDIDSGSPDYAKCVGNLEMKSRCEGLRIEGAEGIGESQLRFLYERGAKIDKRQSASIQDVPTLGS